MKRWRHRGLLRSVSLGLVWALLVGTLRPLWPGVGASYAVWLRMHLRDVLAETTLEAGVQEALAEQPGSLDAFVRAFLQACERKDGGFEIRAALGLPADTPNSVVLAWLLGLGPRLAAEPMLAPLLQVGNVGLWASLLRVLVAVFYHGVLFEDRLPAVVLPVTIALSAFSSTTFLFGAILPMGP